MADIIEATRRITMMKTNHQRADMLMKKAAVKPTKVTVVASAKVWAVLAVAL